MTLVNRLPVESLSSSLHAGSSCSTSSVHSLKKLQGRLHDWLTRVNDVCQYIYPIHSTTTRSLLSNIRGGSTVTTNHRPMNSRRSTHRPTLPLTKLQWRWILKHHTNNQTCKYPYMITLKNQYLPSVSSRHRKFSGDHFCSGTFILIFFLTLTPGTASRWVNTFSPPTWVMIKSPLNEFTLDIYLSMTYLVMMALQNPPPRHLDHFPPTETAKHTGQLQRKCYCYFWVNIFTTTASSLLLVKAAQSVSRQYCKNLARGSILWRSIRWRGQ